MTNIINLRRARKQKTRQDKDKKAADNRARYGKSKQQTQSDVATEQKNRMERDQQITRLDQHRLDGHPLDKDN